MMINLDGLENFDNLEDINKELQRRAQAYNNSAIDDFEALSPIQMRILQKDFLASENPLKINPLSEEALVKSPLLVQVRFLMNKMKGGTELNLTKTGALPTKVVRDIYDLGVLKNEWVEEGITKLYKEDNAPEIGITRILLQISSLAKVRNRKLSLTKKGEKYLDDGNFILKEILALLLNKFNWAYFDGYESEEIGRINAGFSLFLLKKYGDKKRPASFYAEKYFRAMPLLLDDQQKDFRCYAVRTFERYFYYLGFVETEKDGVLKPIHLKKTDFFDHLFSINEH